jgi:hypothetical protein
MRAWWAGLGILLMVAGGLAVTQAARIGQEPAGVGRSGTSGGDAPSAPSRPRMRRCIEGDKGCTGPAADGVRSVAGVQQGGAEG